jgi:hypothetical protein
MLFDCYGRPRNRVSKIAEQLLAGDHLGCKSWMDVAEKFGCKERQLRAVRRILESRGHVLELGGESRTVTVDIERFDEQPTRNDRWPSVAAFDEVETPVAAVPRNHIIKGVSSLVDGETGEIKQQWIKTTAENDERAAWLDAIRSLSESLPPIELGPLPLHRDVDLLAVYPVGDPHIGLLAWREDSGENFDLDIAERQLVGAFKHLIDLAPPAQEALLIFIGDTAHADSQANTTTKGTRVDVDSRTVKMARVIIRICRRAIDLALAKHGRVTMIIERGNHDELISAMIALGLALLYEADGRVTIDTSPAMYHWFRWHSVLIGTHHGDRAKPMDLLGVMAVDRAQDWSEAKHRRFYCGHFHHQIVKEVPGLIVEYLPTLANSDAWHHSMGYRSQRAMYMDVFHREYGHVNRHIVGIQQLRAA